MKSIRHRFLFLIVLVAVPTALFDAYYASQEEKRRMVAISDDLTRSADAVVEKVSDLIDASQELLTSLATVQEITGGDVQACTRLLHKIGKRYSKYTNFSMVNQDKYLVCSSGPLPKPIHLTRSPNVNGAFNTKAFSISPFKFGILTKKPILVFSEPIVNDRGQVVGTINNGLSLTWLGNYFSSIVKLNEEQIVIFDGFGTVLASYPEGAYHVGSVLKAGNLTEQAFANDRGTGHFMNDDSRYMMTSFATIPRIPNGAHVVAFTAHDEIKREIRSGLYRRLMILSFLVAGSLFLGWGGVKVLLINPINRLIAFSDALAKGDLKVRSRVAESTGELERLSMAFNNMAEALDTRTQSLAKAKEEAEKANKAKSEFLASMSHELRTPLNAVLGFAQMLQFDPNHKLSKVQNVHVESIMEGGNHLLALVNDILDLVKIEANQLDLQLDKISANSVVADCMAMMAPLGEQRGIKLINNFGLTGLVYLRTDGMRLKQVLINLLSNAVKFNKDGGSVTVEGHEIETGFLRISVTDTGIGMAEEDQSEAFLLFNRLGSNAMVAKEGAGIGLSVTKILVERMAGRIGCESKVDEGSTFWIDLPLASNQVTLIWTEKLRIGIDALDKDHQTIIALLNMVSHNSEIGMDTEKILEELIDYTQGHFRREEAIMEVCEYPNFKEHCVLHRELIARVDELTKMYQQQPGPDTRHNLQNFLREWLVGHILKVDTDLTAYTKGKARAIREALEKLE